jgi:exopolyphosphatase/guanosine-5'-triphosphate,3'-diphosphate pyrophosphatase
VIDIGATAARLLVAEIRADGDVRHLDFLQQAVGLGKDAFTRGTIGKPVVEECVQALRSFSEILGQYGISRRSDIRAVATSAVREADNRDAFLDRLYMATGVAVATIDDADVSRLTYLSVLPHIRGDTHLARSNALVAEVGGGSTELLLISRQAVTASLSYRLGAFRTRGLAETQRTPSQHLRALLQSSVQRMGRQVRQALKEDAPLSMIALGSDVRFAAGQLLPEWDHSSPVRLPLSDLNRLTDKVLAMSVNDLVRTYHLPFPEAETLGVGLLINVRLGRALKLRNLIVTTATMRDGLLMEMAAGGAWTEEFARQIVESAIELGRKYGFDEKHARRVSELAGILFDALVAEHRLAPRFRVLLQVAGLLHDIGQFVSNRSHHKHSLYLISNSDLFGLGAQDHLLVALVARYHRRAFPKPTHEGYPGLDRDGRMQVLRLAAILRVAEALDRSRSQRMARIRCEVREGEFLVSIARSQEVTLEHMAVQQKGTFFEDVYGMPVRVRRGR